MRSKGIRFFTVFLFLLSVYIISGLCSFNTTAEAAEKGYYFQYKGVKLTIGSSPKKFLKKAGKPLSTKEEYSCRYTGKDRIYKYNDFVVYTSSKTPKSPEFVSAIILKNKAVKTKEGIKVGDSLEKLQEKYEDGDLSGSLYTCTKGKVTLQFTIRKKRVKQIEYL